MRLVGRFSLVCAKLAAAGLLVTGAAACAGVATVPAAVPHTSSGPASTARASGGLNGQPAFVTAAPAVDRATHHVSASSSGRPTATSSTSAAAPRAPGGTSLRAGNPDRHATVPAAGLAVDTSQPDHVIGDG